MTGHLFRILCWRYYLAHPVRWALCTLGVAAGVAVSTAINLTGDQAIASFSSSIETLAGKANLRMTVPGGLAPRDLERLRFLWETGRFSPYVFRVVSDGQRTYELYGFDLFGDRRIREYRFREDGTSGSANGATAAARAPSDVGFDPRALRGLLVPPDSPLGTVGQRIELTFDSRRHEFVIAGTVEKLNGRVPPLSHVYADLGLLLPRTDSLSGVDIYCESDQIESVRARLRTEFPAASVITMRERKRITSDLLGAFRMNLQALGLVALLVSAYLVYNTVNISVLQRRRQISSLLALGAEHPAIYRALLLEGAFLGLSGGIPGAFAGLFASRVAYAEVSRTVSTVYGLEDARPAAFSPEVLIVSLFIGVLFAVLAAYLPARRAARIVPSAGMRAGRSEYVPERLRLSLLAAAGFGLLGGCLLGLAFRFESNLAGICAVFAFTCSLSMLAPTVVRGLVLLWRLWPGVGARLAAAALQENIGRVAVAVAALMMALGLAGAVAIMVFSFRGTVGDWLQRTIAADIYVRSRAPDDGGFSGALDARAPGLIAAHPDVAAVRTMRIVRIGFRDGEIDAAGTELSVVAAHDSLSFVAGGRADLERAAQGEGVLVSEVFANRYNLDRGDLMEIAGQELSILAVFRNFSSERGFVFLDRDLFLRVIGPTAPIGAAAYLREGVDGAAVLAELRRRTADIAVDFSLNRELRERALGIFDRTFRLTRFLQIVSFFIAVLAVMMTLISMILERRREMATLQAFGAKNFRLYFSLVQEAFLLALASLLLAGPGSLMFAWILIKVINRFSFGWTIDTAYPLKMLLGTGAVVLFSSLLAALPALRFISRQNVAAEMRAEDYN